jgi:hypothetical protein
MLSVVELNVFMLDIILPSVIVINGIILNVVAPPRELSPSFGANFRKYLTISIKKSIRMAPRHSA